MKKCKTLIQVLSLLLIAASPAFARKPAGVPDPTPIVLTQKQVQDLLPCPAPLISSPVTERGFAKEIHVQYGNFEFVRTDVGDSDGMLNISKDRKNMCEITLGLSTQIYFSGKLNVAVIARYSGSKQWFVFYDLKAGACQYIGETEGSNTKMYSLVKKLLDDSSGQVCQVSQ